MMMKTSLLPSLILLGVLLASCAPATTPVASETEPVSTLPLVVESTSTLAAPLETTTEVIAPTEAAALTVLPVATSRGPELEATDPTTVNLASGQVQFVEFFRFT